MSNSRSLHGSPRLWRWMKLLAVIAIISGFLHRKMNKAGDVAVLQGDMSAVENVSDICADAQDAVLDRMHLDVSMPVSKTCKSGAIAWPASHAILFRGTGLENATCWIYRNGRGIGKYPLLSPETFHVQLGDKLRGSGYEGIITAYIQPR